MAVPRKTLVALAIAVVAAWLLQLDDELSPDSRKMLDSIEWQEPSEAYVYFLGIGASIEGDPMAEGERLLSKIRTFESSFSIDSLKEFEDENFQPLKYEAPLTTPQGELFCSLTEEHCIDKVLASSEADLANKKAYEILEDRYLTLLNMPSMRSMTKPHFNEYIPQYQPLIRANRLVSLRSIHELQGDNNSDVAIDRLYELIELQRNYIEHSDTLIGKVIGFVLLDETIEVLSLLLRKFELNAKPIEFLSKEQLSFEKAMSREFALARSYMVMTAQGDKWEWVPAWAERITIKANMSSNASAPIYRAVINLSESPQTEFESLLDLSESIEASWVRNFFGTFLNQIGTPNFQNYVARGFDLNAKIALFNGTLGNRITAESLSGIQNPYYKSEDQPAKIDSENKRACFDEPLVNPKYIRCLSLNDG